MGRRKLTALEQLERRFAKMGVDFSAVVGDVTPTDTFDDIDIEAEAVLLYFDLNGKGFEHQVCPVCRQVFAYKYSISKGKMRCSMRCRRVELEQRGIAWKPNRPLEERWSRNQTRGELPLVVPPEALRVLIERIDNERESEQA